MRGEHLQVDAEKVALMSAPIRWVQRRDEKVVDVVDPAADGHGLPVDEADRAVLLDVGIADVTIAVQQAARFGLHPLAVRQKCRDQAVRIVEDDRSRKCPGRAEVARQIVEPLLPDRVALPSHDDVDAGGGGPVVAPRLAVEPGDEFQPGARLLGGHGAGAASELNVAWPQILQADDPLHGIVLRDGEVAARNVQAVQGRSLRVEPDLSGVDAERSGVFTVGGETTLDPDPAGKVGRRRPRTGSPARQEPSWPCPRRGRVRGNR